MNTPKQTPKYRPSLSRSNIHHIIYLCKQDMPTDCSRSVLSILAPFLTKIDLEAVSPSHVQTEKESLMVQLGERAEVEEELTIEVRRYNAYLQWEKDLSDMSIEDLELAHEYRVSNNLLTEEEIKTEDDSWAEVDMSKYTTIKPTTDEDK